MNEDALIALVNELRDALADIDFLLNPELQTTRENETALLEWFEEDPRMKALIQRVNKARWKGFDIAPPPRTVKAGD